MFPDFGKMKTRANRDMLRWVSEQIPAVTPIVRGIATFRQHEGVRAQLVRADSSEGSIDYKESSFPFTLDREEMRTATLEQIQQNLLALAQQMGRAQEKRMLEAVGEAADSVGNNRQLAAIAAK